MEFSIDGLRSILAKLKDGMKPILAKLKKSIVWIWKIIRISWRKLRHWYVGLYRGAK